MIMLLFKSSTIKFTDLNYSKDLKNLKKPSLEHLLHQDQAADKGFFKVRLSSSFCRVRTFLPFKHAWIHLGASQMMSKQPLS